MSRYKRCSRGSLLIVSCKCSGKRERHWHNYSSLDFPSRPPSKFTKRMDHTLQRTRFGLGPI